jgi:pyridoxine kinase
MATVLAVSSFVARGTVGLRSIMPALDRMGHEAIACPTILLSNHLGHPRADGVAVAPDALRAMIDALDGNGWLARIDAVQTGYLPTAEHVRIVEDLIGRVRGFNPQALIVCDPVLGDHPIGLYVPEDVAMEVRDRLVPLATHVKPNRFELSFLSGKPVETLDDVVGAARVLGVGVVLASSIPFSGDRLANVVVTSDRASFCAVTRDPYVHHGTGDLLTALFTAHCVDGEDPASAAGFAAGAVAEVIALSRGTDELQLQATGAWQEAPPLPMTAIRTAFD